MHPRARTCSSVRLARPAGSQRLKQAPHPAPQRMDGCGLVPFLLCLALPQDMAVCYNCGSRTPAAMDGDSDPAAIHPLVNPPCRQARERRRNRRYDDEAY